jgi:hypothetical protein
MKYKSHSLAIIMIVIFGPLGAFYASTRAGLLYIVLYVVYALLLLGACADQFVVTLISGAMVLYVSAFAVALLEVDRYNGMRVSHYNHIA